MQYTCICFLLPFHHPLIFPLMLLVQCPPNLFLSNRSYYLLLDLFQYKHIWIIWSTTHQAPVFDMNCVLSISVSLPLLPLPSPLPLGTCVTLRVRRAHRRWSSACGRPSTRTQGTWTLWPALWRRSARSTPPTPPPIGPARRPPQGPPQGPPLPWAAALRSWTLSSPNQGRDERMNWSPSKGSQGWEWTSLNRGGMAGPLQWRRSYRRLQSGEDWTESRHD